MWTVYWTGVELDQRDLGGQAKLGECCCALCKARKSEDLAGWGPYYRVSKTGDARTQLAVGQ
jgi:hypothetical protein